MTRIQIQKINLQQYKNIKTRNNKDNNIIKYLNYIKRRQSIIIISLVYIQHLFTTFCILHMF